MEVVFSPLTQQHGRSGSAQNQSGAGNMIQDNSTNNTLQNTFSSATYSTLNIAGIDSNG